MKILLLAGHGYNTSGNFDPGCVGFGYQEADLTRVVVNHLKVGLSKVEGVTVDVFEEVLGKSMNPYSYVANKGFNFSPYDYILEVHFNSMQNRDLTGNGKTTGAEILVHTNEKGISVEEAILKHVAKLGYKNRGVVRRDNLLVMNHAKKKYGKSYALIECCFLADKDDVDLIMQPDGIKKYANAVVDGIIEGFGLKYKEVSTPKELTTVNDIVWELANRGIISDSALWLKKLEEDSNSYWLARKTVKYLMNN